MSTIVYICFKYTHGNIAPTPIERIINREGRISWRVINEAGDTHEEIDIDGEISLERYSQGNNNKRTRCHNDGRPTMY